MKGGITGGIFRYLGGRQEIGLGIRRTAGRLWFSIKARTKFYFLHSLSILALTDQHSLYSADKTKEWKTNKWMIIVTPDSLRTLMLEKIFSNILVHSWTGSVY